MTKYIVLQKTVRMQFILFKWRMFLLLGKKQKQKNRKNIILFIQPPTMLQSLTQWKTEAVWKSLKRKLGTAYTERRKMLIKE